MKENKEENNKNLKNKKTDKKNKQNSNKKNDKKQNKKNNKKSANKDKKTNKFIEIIKKKWLINGSKTFLLVAIIVAIFIAINYGVSKLDLTPIDLSQEKLYTLTDESKDKVKNIDKDVNIYFIGSTDDDTNLDLAKQYKKVNEKITAEAVDINNRPDLAQKYGIENGTTGIIVECGEKSKVLTSSDLVTYDTTTYETISVAEEKLTSAILSVTSNKIPKVYFLEGYTDFSLDKNMNYLKAYLQNEINEIDTLNVLTTGKIPDDCDTLVITTPSKDFDDVATNAIIDYINSGRNILWLNAAVTKEQNFENVNKILEMYGVNPFQVGIIRETDSKHMLTNSPDYIIPNVENSKVTKNIYNTAGVIFVNATKINIDDNSLEEKKVTKTELLETTENAYFRTDFNNENTAIQDGEEKGAFIVGAELDKTIKEANEETNESALKSKLVIYGENYFTTDYPYDNNAQDPVIRLGYNKNLVLNSIAYLVDREEDITARKNTGTVTYTATDEQNTIVETIIFTVPALIIIVGIVVWQVRRRKK